MVFFSTVPETCLICVAAVIVGGIDMMSQSLVLAKKPHIVIGMAMIETVMSISFNLHQHWIHGLLRVCIYLRGTDVFQIMTNIQVIHAKIENPYLILPAPKASKSIHFTYK